MEEYKSESTPSRFFFNTNMMTENLMNERELELNRMMIFETHLKLYIGNHYFKSNFTTIGLQLFFCNYLMNENHPKGEELWIMEPQMMKMAWQVTDVSADCGLYLMRHIECYMGEGEGKWESGFSGVKQHDENSVRRLRYKYMYKLLNSDYNMHKDKLTPESKLFSKLDLDKKKCLMQQDTETVERKRDKKVEVDAFF